MKLTRLSLFLGLVGCLYAQPQPKLVWPSPPDPARIAFAGFITKSEDLHIKKSFFSKLWSFFAGQENEALLKPFGLHIDTDQRLYITDTGLKSLIIFSPRENKKQIIQSAGKEKFGAIMDVDTDKQGNIYISDAQKKCIFVLNKHGKFLYKIGNHESLKRPVGISIDTNKNTLYVTDTLAGTVESFSLEGKHLGTLAKGILNRPTYLTLFDQKLYVSDSMNHRIAVLDTSGRLLQSIGKQKNRMGTLANPRGIAIDSQGHIFVSDTTFHNIQIFNLQGQLLLILGSYGSKAGEFAIPEDIAISPGGKIYIADSYNMRIQMLELLKTSHTDNGSNP